jgi:hypothetical protein
VREGQSSRRHAVYEGLAKPDPRMETIAALAALADYRDGTNLTGLNPKEEKLIRHIGFSGHHSPPVMIEMIQRDERFLLEGMLVAINANDRLQFNMQYNVIPVAHARKTALVGRSETRPPTSIRSGPWTPRDARPRPRTRRCPTSRSGCRRPSSGRIDWRAGAAQAGTGRPGTALTEACSRRRGRTLASA